MNVLRVLVLAAIGFTCAAVAAKDDKKPLEQLRGTWAVTKAEPASFEPKQFIFDGDTVTAVFDPKEKKKTKIKVDAKSKPARIDIGEGKKANLGIYELKGDILRICLAARPGDERPTEFKAGEGVILTSFKREKE